MSRRRTRKKGGGRIIGQGAYGCVYRPALACEGNTSPRDGQVSKLVSKRNVDEEYASYSILSSIDPARELYAYPLEKCDFKLNKQNENTKKTLLTPSEKKDLIRNPLLDYLFNYKRINATKVQYRRKGKCAITNADEGAIIQMADAGSTYNELTLTKSDIYGFFEGFENILLAVKTLHEAGYFHHDIKPANILIQKEGPGSFKFRLADFGSMRSLSKSLELYKNGNKVNGIYHSPYPYWPLYTVFLNYHRYPIVHFLNGITKNTKGLIPEEEKELKNVINFNSALAKELADYHIAEGAYSMFKDGNRQSIDTLNDIAVNVHEIFYEKVEKNVGPNSDKSFTNFLQNIDIYSLAITLNLYVNNIFNSVCIFSKNMVSPTVAYKYQNKYLYASDYYKLFENNGNIGYALWFKNFTLEVVAGFYNIVIKFMNTNTLYNLLSIDEFIVEYKAVLEKFKKMLENDKYKFYPYFVNMVEPTLIKPTPSPVQVAAPVLAQPIYSPNIPSSKTKKRGRNNQKPNNAQNQKIQKTNQSPSPNSPSPSPSQENEPFFATNSMKGQ